MLGRQCGEAALQLMHGETMSTLLQETSTRYQSVEECQERQNNQTVPTHPDECIEPDIHFDSMLALDLNSGEIKWNRQLGGYDVWFVACSNFSSGPKSNCPPGPSPDADLEAGPGSANGGGIWGAATDKRRVYTNIANGNRQNVTLVPSNNVTTVVSGLQWMLTRAAYYGPIYAINGKTGEILWSYETGGSVYGGLSVSEGCVYVGNGGAVGIGATIPGITAGTSVFAFCID
ncbi:UNVERIFIED_CONTAM: hypothetical protein Slati_1614100 [Sesamum latifolium]|uniref:Uncharacterized protein n=1 Tax=Sesamum latifolium TaxID=2727402 RepID=A0AAW2X995_9LAMI